MSYDNYLHIGPLVQIRATLGKPERTDRCRKPEVCPNAQGVTYCSTCGIFMPDRYGPLVQKPVAHPQEVVDGDRLISVGKWSDGSTQTYILICNVSYSGKHADSGFFATEIGQTEGTFDLGKRDQEAEIEAFTSEFGEELVKLRETYGEDAVTVLFDVALYSY